ncbi:carbohydrate ABC transporter permease [Oscillospiraceae bacterium PP1C4]
MKKHTAGWMIGKIAKFLFLAFFLVIVLFPFYWMLITSLKSSQVEIYEYPIRYWPKNPSLINYITVISKDNFGRYFLNSMFVSVLAGLFAVSIGMFASYVIARYKFFARGPLLFFFLFTQMIPMFLILAPLYQMMSAWGMTNNLWTLVMLYTNMMIPFSVVTLRGFFQGIPRSIEEAAQIDGCGRLRALFNVILPIMLPGLASTMIFAFVNSWNELFIAIMFIDDSALKTLPVALNGLILKYDIEWGQLSAGTVISIIPTMILFGFSQRYMASGLTAGAVKE